MHPWHTRMKGKKFEQCSFGAQRRCANRVYRCVDPFYYSTYRYRKWKYGVFRRNIYSNIFFSLHHANLYTKGAYAKSPSTRCAFTKRIFSRFSYFSRWENTWLRLVEKSSRKREEYEWFLTRRSRVYNSGIYVSSTWKFVAVLKTHGTRLRWRTRYFFFA